MKLSQLMRSGWSDVEQFRGGHIKYRTVRGRGGGSVRQIPVAACGLGAICLGAGLKPFHLYYRGPETRFPLLYRTFAMPEVADCECALTTHHVAGEVLNLLTIIVQLNDHYLWSKEAIVAFVEECEAEALMRDQLMGAPIGDDVCLAG